jgi:hypothetical protein
MATAVNTEPNGDNTTNEKVIIKIVYKTPDNINESKRKYYYKKKTENPELFKEKNNISVNKWREANRERYNEAQRIRRQKKKAEKEELEKLEKEKADKLEKEKNGESTDVNDITKQIENM